MSHEMFHSLIKFLICKLNCNIWHRKFSCIAHYRLCAYFGLFGHSAHRFVYDLRIALV